MSPESGRAVQTPGIQGQSSYLGYQALKGKVVTSTLLQDADGETTDGEADSDGETKAGSRKGCL